MGGRLGVVLGDWIGQKKTKQIHKKNDV